MSLLDGLNEPQTQAVTSNAKHTLILAGAGSGKTRVLVSRIAFLMQEQGLSSQEILAVTFTNKAAGEMKSRLSQMLSIPLQGLWVGTFHGLCQRLLRRHFQEAHLPEQFYIIDSDDQARIIKRVIAELNLDAEQWPAKKAQFFINTNKDEGLRPQHVPAGYGPSKTWIKIYAAYEQACKTSGVVDFAEIILRTHELFRDNPLILNQYQERFKAVLVDEFQDTNSIQYAWICQLAGGRASVMAVGDDDQSIYGWRGAKIENIENFTKDFQNTQIIRLEQNYRSTGTILEASNNLIANNDTRMGKELWTADTSGEKILRYNAVNEIDEARFVAGRIQMELDKGVKSDEIAILYRSNAQSRVLEEALLQANISYRIFGGMRFFDRAEVKDALAYLRLVVNANDDNAFERVVNFPTRGIGDKTLEEIRAYSKAHDTSLMTSAKELIQSQVMPQRASLSLSKFVQLIENLQINTASLTLDLQLSQIIQDSGLYSHFSKIKGEKSDSKIDNLQELINAGKQFYYEKEEGEAIPLVQAFLTHTSLESGDMQAEEYESSVCLMTLHAAKGLEFPIVFLVGMDEGIFPSKQSAIEPRRLEEERRLCYVGMTRAMKKLILSHSEIRRLYGREEYYRPSRFLKEIPEELVEEICLRAKYQSPQKIKASNFNDAISQYGINLGQRVRHAKFGQGTVLAVEGSGAHTRAQIKFADEGTKWLVLAYANLTPSEEDLPF